MQLEAVQVVLNMYGIQCASSHYAEGLQQNLVKVGFRQLAMEPNMYVRRTKRGVLAIAVTMDDFTVAINSSRTYEELLAHLRLKY